MENNQDTAVKKRKVKTSKELIAAYEKKIEALREKERKYFNKTVVDCFHFMAEEVELLEKVKRLKKNKDFISGIINYIKNFKEEEKK